MLLMLFRSAGGVPPVPFGGVILPFTLAITRTVAFRLTLTSTATATLAITREMTFPEEL